MKTCALTGRSLEDSEAIPLQALRPGLSAFIRHDRPDILPEAWIGRDQLNDCRAHYVEATLETELGEISDIEREVLDSLHHHELISENPLDDAFLARRTLGERLADGIAGFGGSWKFIIIFCGFLAIWITANAMALQAPDPYPFILLNLMLSCVAALQAPLILMSQNRQETRDRERAESDYRINLKAELEIRHLHEKIDHLLQHHSQRLLEIQEIQIDLLRQILEQKKDEPPVLQRS